MHASKNEEKFFMGHLKNHHVVLEYGSGASTIEIAKIVKKIISIEHDVDFFKQIKINMPENASLFLIKPNKIYIEGSSDDGSYDQFKDYVNYPLNMGPFDIIFIDGRARTSCSRICHLMTHENSLIFIHDFYIPPIANRGSYLNALNYLTIMDHCETMYKFKIKEKCP